MEQQDEYEKVKRKRKFEIFCFLVFSLTIVVASVIFIVYKRAYPFSCTPEAKTYMKDISHAEKVAGGTLQYDGLYYPPWAYWVAKNNTRWGCPCLLKPCIRKCCEEGEYLKVIKVGKRNISECYNDNEILWDPNNLNVYSRGPFKNFYKVNVKSDHFFVIVDNLTTLTIPLFERESSHLNPRLLLDDGGVYVGGIKRYVADYGAICVQSSPNKANLYAYLNRTKNNGTSVNHVLPAVGMLISVPCLIITLLVHVLLPPLFNMHGKALVCHLGSLTVTYSTLGVTRLWRYIPPDIVCIIIGYTIQFTTLASFFWLNVMCFDIWWVFSGLVPQSGFRKAAEQFKFRLYSLYAWGSPLLIVVFTLTIDYLPKIPTHLVRPRVGYSKCSFHDRDGTILYMYLPLGVLVLLNTLMFIITSVRLRSHTTCTNGNNKIKDNFNKFTLFTKLSAVMGLNWILEIMSMLVASDAPIWFVTDFANALVGVAMLYLFVFKRRVLIMLNEKLCPNRRIISRSASSHEASCRKAGKPVGMCSRYALTKGADSASCSAITEVSI